MTDRLLSARDAEKVLGIPASTVRTWHQRRARTGLHSVSQDRYGRPQFREMELIALRDGKRQVRAQVRPGCGGWGRLLAAWEVERILTIPASTVNTWHHRRESTGLWPVGKDERGRPLFYEADIIALRRGMRLRDDEGQRIHTMRDLA